MKPATDKYLQRLRLLSRKEGCYAMPFTMGQARAVETLLQCGQPAFVFSSDGGISPLRSQLLKSNFQH